MAAARGKAEVVPTLEVQKQLRKDGLNVVVDRYKLKARRHGDHDNLICLHYIQNKSKMKHKVVQECRGLVIDEANGWGVVAFPYEKFFNYKEKEAAKVQWGPECRIYPKLDGSIATLYHYKGAWHVASSTVPDGRGGLVPGQTFAEVFWEIWGVLKYRYPPTDTGMCFMFEMLDPRHRIICEIEKQNLVLHGARRLHCFTEVDHEQVAEDMGWSCTKPVESLLQKDLDDCVQSAAGMDPLTEEGYVVRDHLYRRIKIKSPAYVSMAYMSGDGLASGGTLMGVSLRGESSEFGSYFPKYAHLLQEVDAAARGMAVVYDPLLKLVEDDYELLSYPPQKFSKNFVKIKASDPSAVDIPLLRAAATDTTFTFHRYLKKIGARSAWELFKSKVPGFSSLFVESAAGLVTPCEGRAVVETQWDEEEASSPEPTKGKRAGKKKKAAKGPVIAKSKTKTKNLFEDLMSLGD